MLLRAGQSNYMNITKLAIWPQSQRTRPGIA